MPGPEHLFDEPITVWRRTGVTASGDPAYGAPATYTGRWMESHRLVTSADGQQIGSTASVMIAAELALEDRAHRGTSSESSPDTVDARKVIAVRVAKRPHDPVPVTRRYFLA